MKKLLFLAACAALASPAAQAAPAQYTGVRPLDEYSRPMNLAPILCVNWDGSSCTFGGGVVTAPTGIPPYQATTQIASMQKGVATSAAVGLTVPANTLFCNVAPVVANVNWESDGSNPTTGASGGFPMNLGAGVQVSGPVAATIKFINQTAASGALITYECYK